MAWCPICDENREINFEVRGDSVGVPTVTDRYNRSGEYIGYEEGKSYRTNIRSVPRCRVCNNVFEFPYATSKEAYFYAKKDLAMRQLQGRVAAQPKGGGWGLIVFIGWIVTVIAILVLNHLTNNSDWGFFLGLAIGIGAGFLMWALFRPGEEEKRNEAQTQALRRKIEELQAIQFTESNYQRLRSGQW